MARFVFREACKLGCEGIVSKRLGSPYRSGHSAHWPPAWPPSQSEAFCIAKCMTLPFRTAPRSFQLSARITQPNCIFACSFECPLSKVKQTSIGCAEMSAIDPSRSNAEKFGSGRMGSLTLHQDAAARGTMLLLRALTSGLAKKEE